MTRTSVFPFGHKTYTTRPQESPVLTTEGGAIDVVLGTITKTKRGFTAVAPSDTIHESGSVVLLLNAVTVFVRPAYSGVTTWRSITAEPYEIRIGFVDVSTVLFQPVWRRH